MPKIIHDLNGFILNEAKRILIAEGYDGLNMRTVAKQCGIATGTIYNYFPRKEDLIIRMMVDYWDDYFQVIDQVDKEFTDFFDKLEQIYIHFKGFTDEFHAIFLSRNLKPMVTSDETYTNKMDSMKRLKLKIEKIVANHFEGIQTKINHSEAAEFILANFIAVSYVPDYSFEQFAKILKVLYQNN